MDLQPHEVASLFPPMSEEEFSGLRDDIRTNGLREPIWLFDGKIIDGRNRYRACRELDIEPQTREWFGNGNGDLAAFVVSLNLHRRHLTESQRAMIAVRIKPKFEAEAKERQQFPLHRGKEAPVEANLPERDTADKGRSREKVATLLNVSPRSVEAAKVVTKQGAPALVQAVDKGEVKVSAAAAVATLPAEQQIQVVAEGPKAVKAKAKEVKQEKRSQASKLEEGFKKFWEDVNRFLVSLPRRGGIVNLIRSCRIKDVQVQGTYARLVDLRSALDRSIAEMEEAFTWLDKT